MSNLILRLTFRNTYGVSFSSPSLLRLLPLWRASPGLPPLRRGRQQGRRRHAPRRKEKEPKEGGKGAAALDRYLIRFDNKASVLYKKTLTFYHLNDLPLACRTRRRRHNTFKYTPRARPVRKTSKDRRREGSLPLLRVLRVFRVLRVLRFLRVLRLLRVLRVLRVLRLIRLIRLLRQARIL